MTVSNTVPTEFTLNNGVKIPVVGLGTWQAPKDVTREAVAYALQNGYRHLDCALIYQNEHEVGEGIKASGVPRKDIFITSKAWNTHHPNVSEGLRQTLEALQTDYLDLYLVHWPVRLVPNETSAILPTNPDGTRSVDRDWDWRKTWAQMEAIYDNGKGPVRAIGVCNWSIPYLEKLKEVWTIVPAINQVEMHPFLPQHALKEYCEKLGIVMEAYSPLGSTGAPLLSDPEIKAVADKYAVSPATICISYQVNRGVVALPKSVSQQRIADNLRVIKLAPEDMAVLDGLAATGKTKRVNTPLWGWDLGFDDWYGPKK